MTALPPQFFWLLLQRLPGLSAGMLRRLIDIDPDIRDPEHWLSWPRAVLRTAGLRDEALASVAQWRSEGMACSAAQQARRDLDWLRDNAVELLPILDPRYPPLLQEIHDPPPLLYVAGAVECLSAPQLAIVGSRHGSPQGLIDAGTFSTALARAGFVVTSGLALGIDAAAHRAALAAGGKTIAVLAQGLDSVYPPGHRELAKAVRAGGALISEMPVGTAPRANQFPSRNRIISGLSVGVLVVEAELQSGSLVTARLALEQNRELFALPGSIHSRFSRGCNFLIRSGATLVQEVADILAELGGWASPERVVAAPATPGQSVALSADAAAVFAAVSQQPTSLDAIVHGVSQPLPLVLALLVELELTGLIENRAGNYLRTSGACTVVAS